MLSWFFAISYFFYNFDSSWVQSMSRYHHDTAEYIYNLDMNKKKWWQYCSEKTETFLIYAFFFRCRWGAKRTLCEQPLLAEYSISISIAFGCCGNAMDCYERPTGILDFRTHLHCQKIQHLIIIITHTKPMASTSICCCNNTTCIGVTFDSPAKCGYMCP